VLVDALIVLTINRLNCPAPLRYLHSRDGAGAVHFQQSQPGRAKMLKLLQAIIARIKALLAMAASWALEADVLLCHAEIKADLLRQAQRYEDEGLTILANELRQRAEEIDLQRPMTGMSVADTLTAGATQTTSDAIAPAALPETTPEDNTPRKPARKQRSQTDQEVKP
jgi:hypothetical protein